MIVFIQLTSAGNSAGPFNLYSNLSGVPFAAGVSKATLLAGSNYNNVPDGTTIIQVKSTGVCTNSIYVEIDATTTTTSSTSSTTSSTTTSTTTVFVETYYRVTQCIYPFYEWTLPKTFVKSVGDVIEFITATDAFTTIHCGTITDDNFVGVPDAELYSATTRSCDDLVHCEIDSGIPPQ